MEHFWEQVELEEYSIYSVYSTSEIEIAGKVGIASWNSGDRLRRTLDFRSRKELFLFHLNWNRRSSE